VVGQRRSRREGSRTGYVGPPPTSNLLWGPCLAAAKAAVAAAREIAAVTAALGALCAGESMLGIPA
jgi:hypothetical protein